MSTPLNYQRYLERIGYTGTLVPDKEALFALQRAHLVTVPFENLDIHYGLAIDFKNAFDKIVGRNRGGFCYELNYTFYQLLKHLGYRVKLISARAYDETKGYGPEYDHMAIIASVNKTDYLVDVGFGEFAFHPLEIELNKETIDPRGVFRIRVLENGYLVVEKKSTAGGYVPEYSFTTTERQAEEFEAMCSHHQTSPASHFTQKRLCSLPTGEGRITLTGNLLKITAKGTTTETEVQTESEAEAILKHHFKIENIKSPLV